MGAQAGLGLVWLIGAVLVTSTPARLAAEPLTIRLSGAFSFFAATGDLGDKFEDERERRDFRTDTNLRLDVVAEDDARGLRYGTIVEVKADQTERLEGDKAFLFVRGGFGQVRLGRDDTAAASINYMASAVAVGTGGLDGEVIDNTNLVFLTPTDVDGPRVIYYSPRLAGLQLGASYTLTDDDLGIEADGGDQNPIADLTLNYNGSVGAIDLGAAVSGTFGKVDTGARNEDVKGVIASALIDFEDVGIAGGIAYQEIADLQRSFYTLGVGTEVGVVGLSLNWGQCFACDDQDNWNMVAGAEIELLPDVSSALEVSYFDEDLGDQGEGLIALLSVTLDF